MDIPEQITTALTVEKIGAANAERGTQMINVFIPEIGIAKYSTTMFFPISVAEGLNAEDAFMATISRGKLKANKEGEWANEYYWEFVSLEDESSEPMAEPTSAQPIKSKDPYLNEWSVPKGARPTDDDRQMRIMLQHASGVVGPAYGDWCALDPATRGTFSDYLKAIAMGATWYLKHVYVTTGYRPEEAQPEAPDDCSGDPWDDAAEV